MFVSAKRLIAFLLVLVASGCSFESDLVSGLECSEGETRADGATCRGGYWVGGTDLDASGDATDIEPDADVTDDAEVEMGCEAETGEEFCEGLGKTCGVVEGTDNCGDPRQEPCGMCPTGETCQEDNTCSCVPESPEEFCARLGKDCGMVTDDDNCGVEQTYGCGDCEGAQECGEEQANVCGCPCNIDGTCFPEGAENPDDQCLVCDPNESTTQWTLEVGRSCDDEDLCTENDLCGNDGVCDGVPKDCSGEDGECRAGMCDPTTGNCFGMAETGTPCSSDNLNCTDDVCNNGICEHELTGGCIIDDTCYAPGATNPSNGCEACLPGVSTSDWSPDDAGTCDDGVSCTTDTCMNGMCNSTLDSGFCLIGGTCVTNGTDNQSDSCETCETASNVNDWTVKSTCCEIGGRNFSNGTFNPNESCEVCDVGRDRTDWSVDDDCCEIGGSYYPDGTFNPANDCQECDVTNSTTDWRNLGSLQSCCPDQGGIWACNGSGMCQKQTGNMETLVCTP